MKKFIVSGVLLVLVAAGYTYFWNCQATEIEQRVEVALTSKPGMVVAHEGIGVVGFPLTPKVKVQNLSIEVDQAFFVNNLVPNEYPTPFGTVKWVHEGDVTVSKGLFKDRYELDTTGQFTIFIDGMDQEANIDVPLHFAFTMREGKKFAFPSVETIWDHYSAFRLELGTGGVNDVFHVDRFAVDLDLVNSGDKINEFIYSLDVENLEILQEYQGASPAFFEELFGTVISYDRFGKMGWNVKGSAALPTVEAWNEYQVAFNEAPFEALKKLLQSGYHITLDQSKSTSKVTTKSDGTIALGFDQGHVELNIQGSNEIDVDALTEVLHLSWVDLLEKGENLTAVDEEFKNALYSHREEFDPNNWKEWIPSKVDAEEIFAFDWNLDGEVPKLTRARVKLAVNLPSFGYEIDVDGFAESREGVAVDDFSIPSDLVYKVDFSVTDYVRYVDSAAYVVNTISELFGTEAPVDPISLSLLKTVLAKVNEKGHDAQNLFFSFDFTNPEQPKVGVLTLEEFESTVMQVQMELFKENL